MKHAEAGGEGGSPGRTARQGSRGAIVPPIRRRHPNRARRADLPHRGAGLLEENGFGVVEAANADAALKLLETRDDMRLLFTDIQCPARYDGMDLARQVHTRWPRNPPDHHFRPNSARSGGNSRSRPLRRQALQSEGSARRSERYDAQSLGQVDRNARETSPPPAPLSF
jgi:CheY-like chemotaxis protein